MHRENAEILARSMGRVAGDRQRVNSSDSMAVHKMWRPMGRKPQRSHNGERADGPCVVRVAAEELAGFGSATVAVIWTSLTIRQSRPTMLRRLSVGLCRSSATSRYQHDPWHELWI